ncbi:putative nuclease HARBI1 isoform X1 [Chanodichthys erythropterus]|uniref:putative nuclease HARBI1 isoform X1 n=2 Tax=Chanodichthys erythropterus TaxID=933992 RepID=UPI00351DFB36
MPLHITSQRRRRAVARKARLWRRLVILYSENMVNPTSSYCHLNRAVPILQLYFDEAADLRNDLRLSRQSILSLTAVIRLDSDHGWERDIEVLLFLFWLGHAASFRVVSRTFDIHKSSVHDIVHRVSSAIIRILRTVIAFPSGDDLVAVGEGFAQLAGSPAFSSAVGAIDGCHIRLKPPAATAQCYLNRKLFHSIQLQAITDHRGKFIDIFVEYPGSVHDVLPGLQWKPLSTCRQVYPWGWWISLPA